MDSQFRKHVEALDAKVDRLIASRGFVYAALPAAADVPKSGVYLFSRGSHHLYVGRSNRIRKRLSNHCRPSATHYQASFAFRLARDRLGIGPATYRPESSRESLVQDPRFRRAFEDAKTEVRALTIRFVEETDQVRQALLEIYAAVRLRTPHNEFATH